MRSHRSSGTRYGRLVLLAGLAMVILILAAGGFFTLWKQRRHAILESGSGLTLLTQGVMEFADRGDGPVVLVIHGSPGGYDQGLVYGEELKRRGFRVISVSRPGYLRTPLLTGVTMEEQADAIDSLLSNLGIRNCAVLAISEGSPSALELARRHPERVTSMVLLSPQSTSLGHSPIASIGYQLFHDLTGDLGCWYLSMWLKVNPRSLYGQMLSIGSSMRPSRCAALAQEALAAPRQNSFLSALAESITPLSLREAGIINDNAQLKDISPYSRGSITSPLLVITGEMENQVPYKGTQDLVSAIPGAKLIVIPEAGHILPIGREFARTWDLVADFLKSPLLFKDPLVPKG